MDFQSTLNGIDKLLSSMKGKVVGNFEILDHHCYCVPRNPKKQFNIFLLCKVVDVLKIDRYDRETVIKKLQHKLATYFNLADPEMIFISIEDEFDTSQKKYFYQLQTEPPRSMSMVMYPKNHPFLDLGNKSIVEQKEDIIQQKVDAMNKMLKSLNGKTIANLFVIKESACWYNTPNHQYDVFVLGKSVDYDVNGVYSDKQKVTEVANKWFIGRSVNYLNLKPEEVFFRLFHEGSEEKAFNMIKKEAPKLVDYFIFPKNVNLPDVRETIREAVEDIKIEKTKAFLTKYLKDKTVGLNDGALRLKHVFYNKEQERFYVYTVYIDSLLGTKIADLDFPNKEALRNHLKRYFGVEQLGFY